jgi:NitT/TauT family transport system substrate-binding protein
MNLIKTRKTAGPRGASLITAGLVLALVAGCGDGGGSDTAAQGTGADEVCSIDVGTAVAGAFFIPMYVALEGGYYEEEGVDVNLLVFNGGSDLMAAMASGSVPIAGGATSSMASAVAEGVETKAIYGLLNTLPYDIVVTEDIGDWAELKGKNAGISGAGSLTDTTARLVLKNHGLEPEKDVQLLETGGGDAPRLAAMSAGQIAMTPSNPGSRPQVDKLGLKVMLEASDFDLPFQGNAIVANTSFIEDEPDCVEAVVRATMRGAAALQDPEQEEMVREAIAEHVGTADKDVVGALYRYASAGKTNPAIFPIDGEVSVEGVETILESRAAKSPKVGALTMDQLIDTTFIDELSGYAEELQAEVK